MGMNNIIVSILFSLYNDHVYTTRESVNVQLSAATLHSTMFLQSLRVNFNKNAWYTRFEIALDSVAILIMQFTMKHRGV